MDVYEGAEQPGLFVEIWNGLSDEAYAAMKAARTGTITPGLPDETEEGRLWRRIDPWIAGGRGKVHIWKFTRITPQDETFRLLEAYDPAIFKRFENGIGI